MLEKEYDWKYFRSKGEQVSINWIWLAAKVLAYRQQKYHLMQTKDR